MQQEAVIRIRVDPGNTAAASDSVVRGLDRITSSARAGAREAATAFAAVPAALSGIAPQIAAAFSVTAVVAFARRAIDGLDALNDFGDAFGTTAEKASALELVALRNGRTLDVYAQSMQRLNAALNEGGQSAEVLRQLGLNTEELKRLDPADALQRVAQAFSRYADDGNKARAIQELFGRSARELAPALKDLAEAGQLTAAATNAQAQQAKAFNDQLDQLKAAFTTYSRSSASEWLPTLTRVAEVFNRAAENGTALKTALDAIQRFNPVGSTLWLIGRMTGGNTGGASGSWEEAQATLQGRRPRNEGGGRLNSELIDRYREQPRERQDYLNKALDDLDKRFSDAKERIDLSEVAALERQRQRDGERLDQQREYLVELVDNSARASARLIEDERARGARLIELDTELAKRRVDAIGLSGSARDFALQQIDEQGAARYQELTHGLAKKAGANVYDDVRDALANAFRDTRNPVRAFAEGLANTVYTRLTSRIADALATSLVGSDGTGGLLGSFLGAITGSGSVAAGASATYGIATNMPFPLATGTNYVPRDNFSALLHKGEAVVPAEFNPAAGGMGGSVTLNSTVYVAPGVSPAAFMAVLDARDQALQARLAQDFSRRGRLARALEAA